MKGPGTFQILFDGKEHPSLVNKNRTIYRRNHEQNNIYAKPGQVERKWYVVDATDVPLGRLSAVVASVLRGKNKPTFTPHTDTGDFVIVINAEKVKLTGKKATDKIYYTHSNHPGGLKSISAGELRF